MLISLLSFGQSVKNITAEAVGNKIIINYQISGLKYYQNISNIDLFVKEEGAADFEGPMEFVTGDVKSGLHNGSYSITWDALKEMSISNSNLIFDVRILVEEEDRSRKIMIMLSGNDVTPIGLRIGQLGKTSWYVEARASLLALEKPSYSFSDGEITDYDQIGYYELSGTKGWQAYSLVAGITQQVSRHIFFYAGVGYGVEKYVIELNNYSYDSQNIISNSWADYKEFSTTGIEIDGGMIVNFKKFLIGAGGTALDFRSFGWTASLGIKF